MSFLFKAVILDILRYCMPYSRFHPLFNFFITYSVGKYAVFFPHLNISALAFNLFHTIDLNADMIIILNKKISIIHMAGAGASDPYGDFFSCIRIVVCLLVLPQPLMLLIPTMFVYL